MLDYNFKLYTVKRVNWDRKVQYWNFWTEYWTDKFDTDCMNKQFVAENIAKEYNAELVLLNVSVKEDE